MALLLLFDWRQGEVGMVEGVGMGFFCGSEGLEGDVVVDGWTKTVSAVDGVDL